MLVASCDFIEGRVFGIADKLTDDPGASVETT